MKKLRFVLTKVLGMAAFLGVGFVAGIGLSWLIGPMESEGSVLLRVLGIAAAAMAAALVQIVAHEAGHMVCGLATGYRFCFYVYYLTILLFFSMSLFLFFSMSLVKERKMR